jgi:hypothetical protein
MQVSTQAVGGAAGADSEWLVVGELFDNRVAYLQIGKDRFPEGQHGPIFVVRRQSLMPLGERRVSEPGLPAAGTVHSPAGRVGLGPGSRTGVAALMHRQQLHRIAHSARLILSTLR